MIDVITDIPIDQTTYKRFDLYERVVIKISTTNR